MGMIYSFNKYYSAVYFFVVGGGGREYQSTRHGQNLIPAEYSSKEKHNKQAGQVCVKTFTCAYFLPGSVIIQRQDPTYVC